jgi:hypothetical protein
LLFKHHSKWTEVQKHRAKLLFERYAVIKQAYNLSVNPGKIFKRGKSKEHAFKHLAIWYNQVEDCEIDAFKTVARSILNFFINRSTNASAESFNAKVKAFRARSRGIRDVKFFLFRLSKIYA